MVDFADQQCVASRAYGSTEHPVLLAFKPSPVGDVMQMSILSDAPDAGARQDKVRIETDGGAVIESSLLAYNLKQDRRRVVQIAVPQKVFEPIRKAKRLSFRSTREGDETFDLDSMPSVMEQLDTCLSDLQKHWNLGLNPERRIRTAARPRRDLVHYLRSADYPAIALNDLKTGIVGFALLIDEAGKIADCTLTASSDVPVLDVQTCAILSMRARFEPAIGADGKPARDAIVARVNWALKP